MQCFQRRSLVMGLIHWRYTYIDRRIRIFFKVIHRDSGFWRAVFSLSIVGLPRTLSFSTVLKTVCRYVLHKSCNPLPYNQTDDLFGNGQIKFCIWPIKIRYSLLMLSGGIFYDIKEGIHQLRLFFFLFLVQKSRITLSKTKQTQNKHAQNPKTTKIIKTQPNKKPWNHPIFKK